MSRPYDIIVYGASGYSGTITCEYLANKAPKGLKWAISGRDKAKLVELKKELESIDSQLSNLEIFVVDATNYDQVKSLAEKTKVLISFVGPYRIYGEPIVRACVEAETDYVDVTGEPPFYNEVIDKYHEVAKEKKLYIIPACGIGSLLTDFAVETLKEAFLAEKETSTSVSTYLKYNGRYAKTFSNGTWNTLINSMSSKPQRSGGKRFPNVSKRAPKKGLHLSRSSWAYPFVEGADKHTINRTNELTAGTTGSTDFNYQQFTLLPLIPPLWLLSTLFTMFLILFFSKVSFVRNFLLKRKIDNGGPSKEQRKDSYVEVYVDGKSESGKTKSLYLRSPGPYDTTGIACAETALALVFDRSKLKKIYGVVTPAAVLNKPLQEHLPERGDITWSIKN